VEQRITTITGGGGGGIAGFDQSARDAIGWPYTNASSIDTRLESRNTDIDNL
jgi:hypothetical protein